MTGSFFFVEFSPNYLFSLFERLLLTSSRSLLTSFTAVMFSVAVGFTIIIFQKRQLRFFCINYISKKKKKRGNVFCINDLGIHRPNAYLTMDLN